MAVRVLIERVVDEGQEVKLHQILTKLRSLALQKAKGYISGETLRSMETPNKFLVISTWNSVEEWKAWQNNPERAALQKELDSVLRAPESTAVYSNL